MGMDRRPGKQLLLVAVICIAVIFCFVACGETESQEMDLHKMTETIMETVSFDAEMQQVRADSISTFIELSGNYEGYMFIGDGSHSDCFGVFAFEEESDAKDSEKAVRSLQEVIPKAVILLSMQPLSVMYP